MYLLLQSWYALCLVGRAWLPCSQTMALLRLACVFFSEDHRHFLLAPLLSTPLPPYLPLSLPPSLSLPSSKSAYSLAY